MGNFVVYEQKGAIVTMTLNAPEERNALSSDSQWQDIVAATERAQADSSVRCVILTGAGQSFCAGGNVKNMRARTEAAQETAYQIRDRYRDGIQQIPLAFDRLEVPVIAAVNGAAVGAGCDLALMADIRIASEKARFAESFLKLGIIPGDGGAWLLPRVVGYSKAAELTFTGDMIDAAQALACGLVSRVVPHDQLLVEANALAARIVANSGPALRLSKRLLKESEHQRLPALLELTAAFQAIAHQTPEHAAAIDAFVRALSKKS